MNLKLILEIVNIELNFKMLKKSNRKRIREEKKYFLNKIIFHVFLLMLLL